MGESPLPTSDTPERIGRYEVLSRIGSGSMGVVYLATDPLIGRRVALKTLSTEAEPGAVDKLRRLLINEAQSAGGLTHPGIVTIYDLVEDGEGRVFLTMEYVEGSDLGEMLRRPDPIPFRFVVETIGQVADVLDYAHLQGVVHRDIKPANLIVTPDLRIKVTDFGIAQLRSSDLAEEIRSLGTPNYLAPERVLGGEVDHRADIYSLGVVLYELLTRHLPFQGESVAELTRRMATEDFTAPEEYNPAIPKGVRAVLEGALEKEPEQRYWSAGEMASELERILGKQEKMSDTVPATVGALEGLPERPAPEIAPDGPPGRRGGGLAGRVRRALVGRRLPVSVGAVALGLTVGVLAIAGLLPARGDDLPVLSVEEQQQREYLTLLREGRSLLARGEVEAAERMLARAEPLASDSRTVRSLLREARELASANAAAELASLVQELLEDGLAALEQGRLNEADTAVRDALELDPESSLARTLEAAVTARREESEARRRARAPAPVIVAKEEESEPAPTTRIVEPIAPERLIPLPDHADLEIDFLSQISRGTVIIYSGLRPAPASLREP